MTSELLFQFALVADSHMNQSDTESTSPYECNKLSNGRSNYVIEQINKLNPDFVIHLGDFINPVPAHPYFETAAEQFKELYQGIESPLHLVPGNHDIGDKPVDWMPAGTINQQYLKTYQKLFGKDYFSFEKGKCQFIGINAQLFNSGLPEEEIHKNWLEKELETNSHKRIFMHTHYPLFIKEPNENGNYDNIDEPSRSWLMQLLQQYKVEAIFAGHVHNYFYNKIDKTSFYILPSTSFVRHDYSELNAINPGDQGGRNDTAKLGFFLVKVYGDGHICYNYRTYGATQTSQEKDVFSTIEPLHSKNNHSISIGLDLKKPWCENREISASGAIDEFERKFVRNDYPLLAMLEMGIQKLRIPLHDLYCSEKRRRMEIFKELGFRFNVYSYGIPDEKGITHLLEYSTLVNSWEAVLKANQIEAYLPKLKELKQMGIPNITLSSLSGFENKIIVGKHFNHFIHHGYVAEDLSELKETWENHQIRDLINGVAFRIPSDIDPLDSIEEIDKFANEHSLDISCLVKVSGMNPAETFTDDLLIANRVAESLLAAAIYKNINFYFDTFEDVDRGYFVRNGLVDRLYNPRIGSRVVTNFTRILNSMGSITDFKKDNISNLGIAIRFQENENQYILLLPCKKITPGILEEFIQKEKLQTKVDLSSGIKDRQQENKKLNLLSPLLLSK
ncbi:MAG: hypothetical protein COA79_09135 [Planctomycetota bacterium]|nr:MAG: hypothetical protein COA79_09135 [Planctomycetota bacterium]